MGMCPLLRRILGKQTQPPLAHPLVLTLTSFLEECPHPWLLTPRIRKQKMMPVERFILQQRDEWTQSRMTGLGAEL